MTDEQLLKETLAKGKKVAAQLGYGDDDQKLARYFGFNSALRATQEDQQKTKMTQCFHCCTNCKQVFSHSSDGCGRQL